MKSKITAPQKGDTSMPKCKISEAHALDYVSRCLSPEETDAFEAHLADCNACAERVDAFQATLHLTDTVAADPLLPERALQEMEMNVYKRLAVAPKESIFSRLRDSLAPLTVLLRWQTTVAASTLVIAAVTLAFLIGNRFQTELPIPLTEVQSADARMQQYRQQHIQRDLEDALFTRHLRNDTWETESRLQRVKEHADGTGWEKVVDAQLQKLRPGNLNAEQ